jgi:alpha-L-rhamnosidase
MLRLPHVLRPWTAVIALLPVISWGAPVALVDQAPVSVTTVAPGVIQVDFGRVAFGNLQLTAPPGTTGPIVVHFGEARTGERINRKPPGTVRYARATATLAGKPVVVAPPADKRNTTAPAVLTPADWGVVLPFRWVEIDGWPGELRPEQILRRAAFARTWQDDAAAFRSSDATLNQIWELCRYTIKATTFAGVYVDGDRERIAYEADAYLNQLSHYASDPDPQMARDTFDRLIAFPTWPTEWAPHMIFMAHADWRQTGDRAWLTSHYAALKPKLLLERLGPDGLIVSTEAQIKRGDIVDWPVGERDGFVFRPINTVVNAFYLRALAQMTEMARAIGREEDAREFAARERTGRAAFQQKLFDPARRLYRDGEGTDHASLHANLFPLAFDLVPPADRVHVAQWLGSRGMACSVYAAQYLMEGLFENGAADVALQLILAPGDRSWRHMVESGTTLTWEAWDQRFKPNQDWNHAWGAAPANLLSRFVVGAEPLTPGWNRVAVRPHPGQLTHCEARIPTPRGPISVQWYRDNGFQLTLELPANVAAHVELPALPTSRSVTVNGQAVRARREGATWMLEDDVRGRSVIAVQ